MQPYLVQDEQKVLATEHVKFTITWTTELARPSYPSHNKPDRLF